MLPLCHCGPLSQSNDLLHHWKTIKYFFLSYQMNFQKKKAMFEPFFLNFSELYRYYIVVKFVVLSPTFSIYHSTTTRSGVRDTEVSELGLLKYTISLVMKLHMVTSDKIVVSLCC